MRIDYARFSPPGHSVSSWKRYSIFALVGSSCFSFLTFMSRMIQALEILRYDDHMPDFREVLGAAQFPFFLFAGGALVFVLTFYLYFRQGAKSIYTMRRIRNRWELHRRCWTLPLLTIAVLLMTSQVLEMVYFLLYLIATPEKSVPVGGSRFWGR